MPADGSAVLLLVFWQSSQARVPPPALHRRRVGSRLLRRCGIGRLRLRRLRRSWFGARCFDDIELRCPPAGVSQQLLDISSVGRSGPKPGIASGALKSQAFSESPTKSRIAGSAAQARRSAAWVSSAGTPRARNARMSVPASIDSTRRQARGIEGLRCRLAVAAPLAGARASSPARATPAGGAAASAAGSGARFAVSCLRRDQRDRKCSFSLTRRLVLTRARPPAERLRIGAIALALEERPLDVMLGDERRHHLLDRLAASAPSPPGRCRPR